MNNYAAMEAIEAYIYENLFEPSYNWPKHYFKKRSYERYTAEKILSLIACSNGVPALVIVEGFIKNLKIRERTAQDGNNMYSKIEFYSTMEDIATDIYDILRAMQ